MATLQLQLQMQAAAAAKTWPTLLPETGELLMGLARLAQNQAEHHLSVYLLISALRLS